MKLEPTFHNPIPMESRVSFNKDAGLGSFEGRTGTVIGIASEHIQTTYVILLDGPPYEYGDDKMRAVCMVGSLITVLEPKCQVNSK